MNFLEVRKQSNHHSIDGLGMRMNIITVGKKLLLTAVFLFPLFQYADERGLKVSSFPKVVEVTGLVSHYDKELGTFEPVEVGDEITLPTLCVTSGGSGFIVAYPGKIIARFGENTKALLAPQENNRYEVDLQLGIVTALLDPERDREKDPAFAIRGSGGVTEATGTFYAVLEYKGQTYTVVKKGEVKKKTTPPVKSDFAAYIKKIKSRESGGQSERSKR